MVFNAPLSIAGVMALMGLTLSFMPAVERTLERPTSKSENNPNNSSTNNFTHFEGRFDLTSLSAPYTPPPEPIKIDPTDPLRQWQLVGVIFNEQAPIAMLTRGREQQLLKVGDSLQGFTIDAIKAEEVFFKQNDLSVSLRL